MAVTDKTWHGYIPFYEALFQQIKVESLLEIGVWHGGSIELFRRMLPEARIVGVDVEYDFEGCIRADATKPFPGMEGPWDVIVDDGSHHPDDIRQSRELLWPYLRGGGYYIIEDVPSGSGVDWRDQLIIIRKPLHP